MATFGWSYPPGAAGDPSAPWNQQEGPCEACGHSVDDCICPECPVCSEQGNPACYPAHGLQYTPAQIAGRAKLAEAQEAQAERDRAEGEYWASPERQKEEAELQQYWADLERHVRASA